MRPTTRRSWQGNMFKHSQRGCARQLASASEVQKNERKEPWKVCPVGHCRTRPCERAATSHVVHACQPQRHFGDRDLGWQSLGDGERVATHASGTAAAVHPRADRGGGGDGGGADGGDSDPQRLRSRQHGRRSWRRRPLMRARPWRSRCRGRGCASAVLPGCRSGGCTRSQCRRCTWWRSSRRPRSCSRRSRSTGRSTRGRRR